MTFSCLPRHQVDDDAQVLAFDASALVVLSDGTTCEVEAPESHVRAKGYKHAVASSGSSTGASGAYGYQSNLDASNGAVERCVGGLVYQYDVDGDRGSPWRQTVNHLYIYAKPTRTHAPFLPDCQ